MFRIFIFLLIFTPLAFGTVEPWSYAIMEILTLLGLSMLSWKVIKNRDTLLSVPGIVPFLLFLGYILFQLIPLPPWIVEIVSPHAYRLHSVQGGDGIQAWMTLSVHPAATLQQFFRWSTYCAFYVLTVQILKSGDHVRKTVIAITIFGALLSFSSILQFYLTDDMALWIRHVPKNSMIVGPYICHNHYAGLMEMIFPVVLGLFFFHRPRTRNVSFLKGVAEILSQERANIHILIGMAALLIGTSVFVSLSRGGMLSLCISLVFFTSLVFKRKINRSNALLIVAIIILTAISVGWFGWENIVERFARLKNAEGVLYNSRLDFWKDSIRIIPDFLVTGSGIGTYADIYTSYKSVTGNFLVNHAHNDYLELAVEGGIIGFILAAAFIVTLFVKTFRMFLSRKDAYAVYIYMGSISGIIALLIHSIPDFNLHVGANGLWFFFLAGLAVSSATAPMRGHNRPSRLSTIRSPSLKKAATGVVAVLFVGTVLYNLSQLTADYYYAHIDDYQAGPQSEEEDLVRVRRVASVASFLDPLDAEYPFTKATAALYLGNETEALQDFSKAIRLNPTNSFYLSRLGNILARRGKTDAADRLLSAAAGTDISNADYQFDYGAWLLSEKEKAKGLDYIKRSLAIAPKEIDSALVTMTIYGASDEEIRNALPESPEATVAYAEFLYGIGETEAAAAQYTAALSYMEHQEKINRRPLLRIYNFYMEQGEQNQAMRVLVRASELMPGDVQIRILLGDMYRDMGITYRASEEYQQALLTDPNNSKARRRLEKLESVSP